MKRVQTLIMVLTSPFRHMAETQRKNELRGKAARVRIKEVDGAGGDLAVMVDDIVVGWVECETHSNQCSLSLENAKSLVSNIRKGIEASNK